LRIPSTKNPTASTHVNQLLGRVLRPRLQCDQECFPFITKMPWCVQLTPFELLTLSHASIAPVLQTLMFRLQHRAPLSNISEQSKTPACLERHRKPIRFVFTKSEAHEMFPHQDPSCDCLVTCHAKTSGEAMNVQRLPPRPTSVSAGFLCFLSRPLSPVVLHHAFLVKKTIRP
jgi:hypothetical protein